jgi:hypothetical protein
MYEVVDKAVDKVLTTQVRVTSSGLVEEQPFRPL